MRSITLALSFIRVPRLFTTLLLWPLLTGIGVAVVQITATAAYIRIVDENLAQFEARLASPDKTSDWIRAQLFQSKEPSGPIKVCRWKQDKAGEVAPSEDCQIQPLDIAIKTATPASYNPEEYVSFFQGSARRLHVCETCTADIVISEAKGEKISNVYSLGGLGVYMLTEAAHEKDVEADFLKAKTTVERLKNLSGTIFLHPAGLNAPVNITKASAVMVLVLNTAFLIIITLWLSLVGHRKVLHYFARNDALLPLVAACGKAEFYNSLWVITLLRVSFFLFATLPATCLIYVNAIPEDTLAEFMGSGVHFLLWISAIISSLSTLTIIASIAELKHRHSLVSFLYRYIPILCFAVGTGTWLFTIFSAGNAMSTVQYFVSALPLFGLSPIVLSPVFKLDPMLMAAHTVVASLFVVILLRINSRWFAAHLEEI